MNQAIQIDDGQRFFSDGTPAALARLLNDANATADPDRKGALLRAAVEEWPGGLDAHIALYKFYFRTAQYRQAEKAVWATLREAAQQGGFNWKYRHLTATDAEWLDDHSVSRLYLFSLKALGVIRLRRGRIGLAKRVLEKLMALDPHDEVGGGTFLGIARRFDDVDGEE